MWFEWGSVGWSGWWRQSQSFAWRASGSPRSPHRRHIRVGEFGDNGPADHRIYHAFGCYYYFNAPGAPGGIAITGENAVDTAISVVASNMTPSTYCVIGLVAWELGLGGRERQRGAPHPRCERDVRRRPGQLLRRVHFLGRWIGRKHLLGGRPQSTEHRLTRTRISSH